MGQRSETGQISADDLTTAKVTTLNSQHRACIASDLAVSIFSLRLSPYCKVYAVGNWFEACTPWTIDIPMPGPDCGCGQLFGRGLLN